MTTLAIGSQFPRLSHLPPGSRTAADDVIGFAELCGLDLDPWQRWVLDGALRETSEGKWAAFECVLIVPRRNGKSALLQAIMLAAVFAWGERTVIYSAHRFDTAQETFLELRATIEGSELASEVAKIYTANGKEAIILKNGARIKFMARSRGSGRGWSGDRIIFDEAMDLPSSAMGGMVPALASRSMLPDSNPQIWYASSAPNLGSDVLHSLRRRGQSENPGRMFFAEWSAEDDAANEDVSAWYQANPALGIRISEDFVRDEYAALAHSPQEFARERLGIVDNPLAEHGSPIPGWAVLADPLSQIVSGRSWALAVSPFEVGPQWASIGVAGRRDDGRMHVEWMEHRQGTAWIVEYCRAVFEAKRIPLRVHKLGPEGALIASLREAGVEVVEVSSIEVAQATGLLVAEATGGDLVHLGQPSLDVAVRNAVLRTGPSGSVAWSQRRSSVEITPLQAVTVAAGGVPTVKPSRPGLAYSF